MSKTWKWILGIVLRLVILFGIGFAVAYFFGFGPMSFRGGPAYYGHPMMGDDRFGNRGPLDGFWNFRHPMMGGHGYGGYAFISLPFLFFGGLLRLVFPLGVLALVAYVAYQQGKKAGMNAALATPASESVSDTEPKEAPKQRGRKVA